MGGRLIHKFDLYTSKYGTLIITVKSPPSTVTSREGESQKITLARLACLCFFQRVKFLYSSTCQQVGRLHEPCSFSLGKRYVSLTPVFIVYSTDKYSLS